MKVNTDAVLLGALASPTTPNSILDVGTGTGVIALMLAQRFLEAKVDAVEINFDAAKTASSNFDNSVFKGRLCIYANSFQQYFDENSETKYDLIVSNPPFFIGSLKSNSASKTLARHTDSFFFTSFFQSSSAHLNKAGIIELILPLETAALVKKISLEFGLILQKQIFVQSFSDSKPHREIVRFGFDDEIELTEIFIIYNRPKEYSMQYQRLLEPFLTIF